MVDDDTRATVLRVIEALFQSHDLVDGEFNQGMKRVASADEVWVGHKPTGEVTIRLNFLPKPS